MPVWGLRRNFRAILKQSGVTLSLMVVAICTCMLVDQPSLASPLALAAINNEHVKWEHLAALQPRLKLVTIVD